MDNQPHCHTFNTYIHHTLPKIISWAIHKEYSPVHANSKTLKDYLPTSCFKLPPLMARYVWSILNSSLWGLCDYIKRFSVVKVLVFLEVLFILEVIKYNYNAESLTKVTTHITRLIIEQHNIRITIKHDQHSLWVII